MDRAADSHVFGRIDPVLSREALASRDAAGESLRLQVVGFMKDHSLLIHQPQCGRRKA